LPLCASIAWEGQGLEFASPDTGQDRWNFADGDPSRADRSVRMDSMRPHILTFWTRDHKVLFDSANGEVGLVIRRQKVHHETAVQ
jgi:hypothetical protein